MLLSRLSLCITIVYLSLSLLHAGDVKGTITLPQKARTQRIAIEKYKGKISGEVVTNPAPVAAVWLTAPGLNAPKSPPSQRFEQKGYQFESSLIAVPKNTTITFPNEDNDYHNVFSLSQPHRFDLGRYKKGERPAPSFTFSKAGFITLRCEIHEHMRANVVVVDSPYVTTTDAGGKFILTNIPPGTYTLHAQLDKKTTWETTVTVKSKGTLTLPPLSR